jgi:hypothetical protein
MSAPGPTTRLIDAAHEVRRVMSNIVRAWSSDDDAGQNEWTMAAMHGLVSLEESIENAIADLHEAGLDDAGIRSLIDIAKEAGPSPLTKARQKASGAVEADDPVALARAMQQRRHGASP